MSWIRNAVLTVLKSGLLLGLIAPACAQSWINSVSVSTTTNKATIQWTTAVPASAQIKYGPTANYGTRNTLDPLLVTRHSMTLTSLTTGRLYHFRIMSSDMTGSQVTSMDYTFTTQAGAIALSVTPVTAT